MKAKTLTLAVVDSWWRESHRGSGTAVAINGLVQALQAKGHRVIHLGPQRLGPSLTLSRLLFNLRILPQLRSFSSGAIVGIDWDGWLYALLRKKTSRYVVCIKGILADEARFETGLTRRLLETQSLLERINAMGADLVVTTSRYSNGRLQQLYGLRSQKIAVLPEGIDLARWSRRLARFRKNRKGVLTILCVARQYPRKRIALLLRATSMIKAEFPRLRLRIVGDGPEHRHLKQEAAVLGLNDALLGPVANDDELVREYAQADIFCLPSVQEGFGIVFLEAMAAGLPIVATRAAAVPEIVRHGVNGLLASPDDVSDLAAQLRCLLLNAGLRRRLGRAGKRLVQQYDWKTIATRFETLIKTFPATTKARLR